MIPKGIHALAMGAMFSQVEYLKLGINKLKDKEELIYEISIFLGSRAKTQDLVDLIIGKVQATGNENIETLIRVLNILKPRIAAGYDYDLCCKFIEEYFKK